MVFGIGAAEIAVLLVILALLIVVPAAIVIAILKGSRNRQDADEEIADLLDENRRLREELARMQQAAQQHSNA